MNWPEMSTIQRRDTVHQRYAEGWTPRQIADRYQTTRNAVLGCAWRWNITLRNARGWTEAMAVERIAAVREERLMYYRSLPRKNETPTPHRARRAIRATDPATRAALEKLNRFPFHHSYIAEVMGVTKETMSNWWSGRNPMSKLSLSLVDETVRRLQAP